MNLTTTYIRTLESMGKAASGGPSRIEPMSIVTSFFNGADASHYNVFRHSHDDEYPETGEIVFTTSGVRALEDAEYIAALLDAAPSLIAELRVLRADKDSAHARAAEREAEIDALEAKLTVGSLTMALCKSGVVSLRDQRSKRDLPRRYATALRAALLASPVLPKDADHE